MNENHESNKNINGYNSNWFSKPEESLAEDLLSEKTVQIDLEQVNDRLTKDNTPEGIIQENETPIESVPASPELPETEILQEDETEKGVEIGEKPVISTADVPVSQEGREPIKREWTMPNSGEPVKREWTTPKPAEPIKREWTTPKPAEPIKREWTTPKPAEPIKREWTAPSSGEPVKREWTTPKPAESVNGPRTAPNQAEYVSSERKAPSPVRYDSTYAYNFRDSKPQVGEAPKKAEHEKKPMGFLKKMLLCAVLALVFGLISGGVFVGVNVISGELLGINEQREEAKEDKPESGAIEEKEEARVEEIPKVEDVPAVESGADVVLPSTESGELTVAQVAERCMPAMVAITNISITEVPNFFGFGSQNYESTSSGSGIIIDQTEEELLIATNNHVVAGASSLTIGFIDDELVEATIKGTDPENDLAVVSVKLSDIPNETLEQIRVIQIGNSDELAVGDQVVAIGNALGYGQSVSSGWISALNREVIIDNMTLTLLQTDAAINPGNSGGALLNMKGELIAINESKYADTTVEGMGYAIPVSTATPILSELMTKTTRYKVDEEQASYIGITCKDFSEEVASMYDVPPGVYVDSVEENGPAAQAGIKKGDIIIEFDGNRTYSSVDLVSQLEYYAAGEIIEVTFCRADEGDYNEHTVQVTLGARRDSGFVNQESE